MAQALGVVNIFIPSEPTEHRLSQQTDESMPAVLAGARVGEHLAHHRAEAERIVEFAVGQQSSIGCDDRPSKLERQSAVELEPENAFSRFTRWVRHDTLIKVNITCYTVGAIGADPLTER
jgi:hypothetical protein